MPLGRQRVGRPLSAQGQQLRRAGTVGRSAQQPSYLSVVPVSAPRLKAPPHRLTAVADCLARLDRVCARLRSGRADTAVVAELDATVAELREAVVDVAAIMGVLTEAVAELHDVVGT
jgi:hypothetical protein